jgi:hypothetical protein
MRRIAALPPEIGNKLDELLTPLDTCRHVAFGKDAAEQLERAVEALARRAEAAEGGPRRDVRPGLPDVGEHVAFDAELLDPAAILRGALAEVGDRRPRTPARPASQPTRPGGRRAASERTAARASHPPVTRRDRPQG